MRIDLAVSQSDAGALLGTCLQQSQRYFTV